MSTPIFAVNVSRAGSIKHVVRVAQKSIPDRFYNIDVLVRKHRESFGSPWLIKHERMLKAVCLPDLSYTIRNVQ